MEAMNESSSPLLNGGGEVFGGTTMSQPLTAYTAPQNQEHYLPLHQRRLSNSITIEELDASFPTFDGAKESQQ